MEALGSKGAWVRGWLLDLYPAPEGMVLWTLDAGQKRRRLVDASFAPAFYVGGPLDEIARLTPQLPA